MGIDYSVFISTAPTVTEDVTFYDGTTHTFTTPVELPHETVAAVANLFTGDNVYITVQDVREYVAVKALYSDAPNEYDAPEGALTEYYFWKIINDNPKWSVIDALWNPGSSAIHLGRRFGAHQIIEDAECEDAHEYVGSFVNFDATRGCIELCVMRLWNMSETDAIVIADQMHQMGFDGISWG